MKTLLLAGILIISAESYATPTRACTNFSGDWGGTCYMNGQTAHSQLKISQNGCEGLTVNGQSMAIGGLMSEGHVAPIVGGNVYSGALTSLWWNGDKSGLQYFSTAYIYNDQTGGYYEDRQSGTVTLDNGRLLTHSKSGLGEALCDHGPIVD
jgi:hypothetical protein